MSGATTTTHDPAATLPNVLAVFRRGTDAVIVQVITTAEGWGRVDVRKWTPDANGRWVPSPAGVRLRGMELGDFLHAVRCAEPLLADIEARRAGGGEDR